MTGICTKVISEVISDSCDRWYDSSYSYPYVFLWPSTDHHNITKILGHNAIGWLDQPATVSHSPSVCHSNICGNEKTDELANSAINIHGKFNPITRNISRRAPEYITEARTKESSTAGLLLPDYRFLHHSNQYPTSETSDRNVICIDASYNPSWAMVCGELLYAVLLMWRTSPDVHLTRMPPRRCSPSYHRQHLLYTSSGHSQRSQGLPQNSTHAMAPSDTSQLPMICP